MTTSTYQKPPKSGQCHLRHTGENLRILLSLDIWSTQGWSGWSLTHLAAIDAAFGLAWWWELQDVSLLLQLDLHDKSQCCSGQMMSPSVHLKAAHSSKRLCKGLERRRTAFTVPVRLKKVSPADRWRSLGRRVALRKKMPNAPLAQKDGLIRPVCFLSKKKNLVHKRLFQCRRDMFPFFTLWMSAGFRNGYSQAHSLARVMKRKEKWIPSSRIWQQSWSLFLAKT